MLWWTLRQLNSKSTRTRQFAASKLGKSGKVKAVKPLIAALKDRDSYVSQSVAEALEALK
jgi:HEAT repeat protein